MERKATSIKIDPDLWKQTKIQAIQDEITVSELLEDSIKNYIKRKPIPKDTLDMLLGRVNNCLFSFNLVV